ncbi:MAG: hypothetical protein KAR23_06775, partial [Candidatus Aenigmarchaeota archaeon]|nr:hypothetical protein [Candidatus Aenigmarchaeota archaeon]
IRIRKYATPEPTSAVGGEENRSVESYVYFSPETVTECIPAPVQVYIDSVFKIEMILDTNPLLRVDRGSNTYISLIPETGTVCVIDGIQKKLTTNFVFNFNVRETTAIHTRPQGSVSKGNYFISDINIKKHLHNSEIKKEEISKITKTQGLCENLGLFVTDYFIIQIIKDTYDSGTFTGNNFKTNFGTDDCEQLLNPDEEEIVYGLTKPVSLTAVAQPTKPLNSELGKIVLTWIDTTAIEDGFKIERSTDGSSYSQIGTVGVNAITYADDNLDDNTVYYYRVRSYKSSSNSDYSTVASTTTKDRTGPESPYLVAGALEGIVAYYKFDDGAGDTANDETWNNNDGTRVGATWTTGYNGGALSFDGDGDYVSIPNSDDWDFGTGNFAVEFWLYPESDQVNAYGEIFGMGDAHANDKFAFLWYETGTFVVYTNNNPILTTSITGGDWYHVVYSRDSGTHRLYIDAVEKDTDTTSKDYNSDAIHIGETTYGSYDFNGKIDEVRIYNRALSPREVKKLYEWAPGP